MDFSDPSYNTYYAKVRTMSSFVDGIERFIENSICLSLVSVICEYHVQANYAYTSNGKVIVTKGSLIAYTLSIPSTSANAAYSLQYLQYLRSTDGLGLASSQGVITYPLPTTFFGNVSAVPASFKS
jgi:hypothetical protein